ncbi:MAG: serine/threonine protein kinase [Chloroflexi bacterium]|nr:serine/threonine protein kinase [Chloroflexota bacterium]
MMAWSVALYSAALQVYPAEFRAAYADEMRLAYQDWLTDTYQQRGWWGVLLLWGHLLLDLLCSALREHLNPKDNQMLQVDNYRIESVIGAGSVSDVFRATDVGTGQTVALKMLHAKVEDNLADYFEAEADLMQSLHHDSLPKFLGLSAYMDRPYIVMEYIDGLDWLTRINLTAQPLPVDEVISGGMQLCDFLSYLHEKDLVYRDMKPSNVLPGPDGRLRVLDLGITRSKPTDWESGRYDAIGTQGYAAPEQYEGRVSPLADIYALGATLHHVLTLRDPRDKDPFLFAYHPPSQTNPAVSAELEQVILKATAFNPEDRYASAAEMKAALAACQS